MEQEQDFKPEQSLMVIQSMIKTVQSRYYDNGTLYLLWGWVILLCSIGHYLFLLNNIIEHPEKVWLLTIPASAFHFIWMARQSKKKKVTTYADEIIGYAWLSFAACMTLTYILFGTKGEWHLMYSVILMVYGIPTFISGAVMRFKPLLVGGFVCWILSAISHWVEPIQTLLLVGLAVTCAWIIPGYILRHQFNRQHNG